jgi:2,3-bisphosphoglycerate-independent phosphoglycerate mutase
MILLCVLDGFGLRPEADNNAVIAARKPNILSLSRTWPNRAIEGSGLAVGLPEGQMGNSEVGHLNLGAGRIVHQDITRIDNSIEDGSFFKNEVLERLPAVSACISRWQRYFTYFRRRVYQTNSGNV